MPDDDFIWSFRVPELSGDVDAIASESTLRFGTADDKARLLQLFAERNARVDIDYGEAGPSLSSVMVDLEEVRLLRTALANLSGLDTHYLDHKLARTELRLAKRKDGENA